MPIPFAHLRIRPGIFLLTCLCLGFFAGTSLAGGPENVLLVVNAESAESVAVANHYISLRQIPPNNVVYLDNIPPKIKIELDVFTDRILKPVTKEISDRKLSAQIDYIIYSSGFPTTVKTDRHFEVLAEQNDGVTKRAFRPEASITSLTFFYGDVLADRPNYFGLNANWYMRRTNPRILTNPFLGDKQRQFQRALGQYQAGQLDDAIVTFKKLLEEHPLQAPVRYQLVRALAAQKKFDQALEQLRRCVKTGWCYRGFTEKDKALSELVKQKGFSEVAETIPRNLFGQLPTQAFSNKIFWGANGWANSRPDQGRRFVLSTQLAVTGENFGTLDDAIAQLQRSAAADSTFPKGTFYFANTKDVRCKARANQFGLAIAELKKAGFNARTIPSKEPKAATDIIGATLGAPKIDLAGNASSFVPGAICDNLTSFGGRLGVKHGQTKLSQYLKEGAAGASGTVCEPLAIHQKFPAARLHLHYVRGCTLAESFYQSISGPFQLLIVGDPLCKPWAERIEFDVAGLKDGDKVPANLSIFPSGTNPNQPIRAFELFIDGKRAAALRPDRQSRINLGPLGDGYHEIRVVAVADNPVATRTGKMFGVTLDKQGHSVKLNLAGNGKYQLNRSIPLSVESNVGDRIEIYQNSRMVGTIKGQKGKISLNCVDLGQGPSSLRAVAVSDAGRVSSRPAKIEITP